MTAVCDLSDDPFAHVLGPRRGLAQNDTIRARRPSARAKQELDELQRELSTPQGLERAIALCRGTKPGRDFTATDRRPLVEDLAYMTVRAIGDYALERWNEPIRRWLDSTGVRPRAAGQLAKNSTEGMAHVYESGRHYASAGFERMLTGRSPRTLCGRVIGEMWIGGSIGEWEDNRANRCERCENKSIEVEFDDLDMRGTDVLPVWAQERLCNELGARVLEAAGPGSDLDELLLAHLPDRLVAVSAEVAADRGEMVFQWVLGSERYDQLLGGALGTLGARLGVDREYELGRWLASVPLLDNAGPQTRHERARDALLGAVERQS